MSRFKVFQWRLAGSGALLLLVFALVRVFWYPGAYFEISGVQKHFWILAGAMFVIGPVLSTFFYKPGKKSLARDFGILAAIEVVAVVAAVALIFQDRPYFSVFAVDRFEAVSRPEVVGDDTAYTSIEMRPGRTPRLIYAKLPEDPEVFSRLIDETVFLGMADIDRRPEFWEPYASGVVTIEAAARPLDRLLEGTAEQQEAVQHWLSARESRADEFVYMPLRGKVSDAIIILSLDIGLPVATLAVDPW